MKVLGANYDRESDILTMYFRDSRGFKYRVVTYTGYGGRDFFYCSGITVMTHEEYLLLPDHEE